ncbi:MAG: entericidin A/B family lipoprotein [Arenimonas sp.]
MKRALMSLLLLCLYTLSLTACHTMAGVGKDVQEVGEEVEETAEGN